MMRPVRAGHWAARSRLPVIALLAILLGVSAHAEKISAQHVQLPMHASMVTRNEAGKIIAHVEVSQVVQGDEVTIRRTYHFLDGSFDEDTTTFTQQGAFRLIRDHEIQKGPFFAKPVDFTVNAATGMAITRTVGGNGKAHDETEHFDLPDNLANGLIGTLLLNAPHNASSFRVGLLAPVNGGRLIQLLISREGEKPFQLQGRSLQATVYRIHPELGGLLGVLAQPFGLQPKDVMVWISDGTAPEVVRIVGQLGGSGPVIDSELQGASF